MTAFQQKFIAGTFAIIFDEQNRVLLAHRTDMDLWNLPGGGLEANESPADGAIREVKEEIGVDVGVERFLGVYVKPNNTIVFAFVCKIVSGKLTPLEETDDIKYFDFFDIPRNISPGQLERIKDALDGKEGLCKFQTSRPAKELIEEGKLEQVIEGMMRKYRSCG